MSECADNIYIIIDFYIYNTFNAIYKCYTVSFYINYFCCCTASQCFKQLKIT